MRKVVTSAFITLDGVMQAPGGPEEDPSGGFEYGGWVPPLWDETLGEAMTRLFAEPFDLLLGRKTYDIFAAHWPFVEVDPTASELDALNARIATRFNAAKKYVATHRPESLAWRNSEALGSDAASRLRQLKEGDGPTLLTQGSSELVQTLLAHDLIDELRLLIFPLTLGPGKRLLGGGTTAAAFVLRHSTVSPNGVQIATYERSGKVSTGSFANEEPTEAELERRKHLE